MLKLEINLLRLQDICSFAQSKCQFMRSMQLLDVVLLVKIRYNCLLGHIQIQQTRSGSLKMIRSTVPENQTGAESFYVWTSLCNL